MSQCRSYVFGEIVCRDGFFPVNGACRGNQCLSCGTWTAERRPPPCLREDLAPHVIDEAGKPKLYPRPSQ